MENKEMFISLLKKVQRPGIKELIEYLENSDFFDAPASTKYHLSIPGGLLQHSLNVYFNLKKMCNLNEESIILVSLLHDICKANFYKEILKNQKNDSGEWEQVKSYIIDELFPCGHGEKSVIIVQKYIDLTPSEILAIRWHMGGFVPKEEQKSVNKAFNSCELAVWLHLADLKATYIDEIERSNYV